MSEEICSEPSEPSEGGRARRRAVVVMTATMLIAGGGVAAWAVGASDEIALPVTVAPATTAMTQSGATPSTLTASAANQPAVAEILDEIAIVESELMAEMDSMSGEHDMGSMGEEHAMDGGDAMSHESGNGDEMASTSHGHTLHDSTGGRAATAEEVAAAAAFVAEVEAAIEKYQDPAVAIADGYMRPIDVQGPMAHWGNRDHRRDGVLLDPTRPESLVYYTHDGVEILAGVVFTAPAGSTPPQPGGPLSVWHDHQDGAGQLMLHVWTFPGVADNFGTGWMAAAGLTSRSEIPEFLASFGQ